MPVLSSPTHAPTAHYSAMTGLIYVFNVIVGTGALAIPGVVAHSGYLLSSFVLLLLGFISYITVTFTIEAMSISNAVILTSSNEEENEDESAEEDPLLQQNTPSSTSINSQQILGRQCFDISKTVEMSHMAHLYFPKYAITIFYLTLVIYLYGDLAIYITVVSKSIRDVVCAKNNSMSCTDFFAPQLDPEGAYRLFCILFIMTIGPFAFLNISKTKYLQMTTTLFRWTAFTAMIVLAIIRISGEEVSVNPTKANLAQLPSLFGVCIYSFMCHHSLPSLVTPIRNKQSVNLLFALDYLLIAVFYIFLAVTGVFAFSTVKDVYTLNFIDVKYVNVLLPLFPVATLSTNFPIISITLKNNLKTLFGFESDFSNIFYTLLAILPPFLVSVFISDVTFLVNVTGSFAGVGIQYVIPTMVVYLARRKVGENCLNPFASPFRGDLWIYLVLGWSSLAVVLVVWHMLFN